MNAHVESPTGRAMNPVAGPCGGGVRTLGPDDAHVECPCAACGEPFRAGDEVVDVPLGPGAWLIQRVRCELGQSYTAVAVVVHAACAGRAAP